MKLRDFLKKYEIKIDKETKDACEQGIKIMRKAKDPLHNEMHVLDIISLLDSFLTNDKNLIKRVDFSILLPAICWHDVWKSTRFQTDNLLKFKLEWVWDGTGSARMFSRYANSIRFPKSQKKQIYYCIREHAPLRSVLKNPNINQNKTEARILRDLDRLDMLNNKRLKNFEKKYLDKNGKLRNKKHITLVRHVYQDLKSKDSSQFFYAWSWKEFDKKRQHILQYIEGVIRNNTQDL